MHAPESFYKTKGRLGCLCLCFYAEPPGSCFAGVLGSGSCFADVVGLGSCFCDSPPCHHASFFLVG
jgi:hypothetical protein